MSTAVYGTPLLANAAISGFVAGKRFGRAGADPVVADDAPLLAAATTFAIAMDAALTASANANITALLPKLATAGATVVPATAANSNAGSSAPVCMASIVQSYFANSALIGSAADTTAATYNPGSAAAPTGAVGDILAAFTACVGGANGFSLL